MGPAQPRSHCRGRARGRGGVLRSLRLHAQSRTRHPVLGRRPGTGWAAEDGIRCAVTALLSSGFSGFSYNHTDIGGYITTAIPGFPLKVPFLDYRRSRELLWRWIELNAFTAVFRTHEGNQPGRNTQIDVDPATTAHFARFARVYAALSSVRTPLGQQASERGLPVVRHPWLAFPDDPQTSGLRWQFCLGPFMVAPVLDQEPPGHALPARRALVPLVVGDHGRRTERRLVHGRRTAWHTSGLSPGDIARGPRRPRSSCAVGRPRQRHPPPDPPHHCPHGPGMSGTEADQGSLWKTVGKLLVGFAVIFALSALLGVYFNEPLEAFGTMLIDRFGLAGLAAATFFVDCVPTPLGYIPFMLLANVGGVANRTIFLVCFGASFTAGLTGYAVGRGIGMPPASMPGCSRSTPECGTCSTPTACGGWCSSPRYRCPWRSVPGPPAPSGCPCERWRSPCSFGFRRLPFSRDD